MSLRLRLVLAFVAIVSLLGVVGAISIYINREIQEEVAHLTRSSTSELRKGNLLGQAFEIEGFWDKSGVFIATEIDKLPRPRRPKLRGHIGAVNREKRTIEMYGVHIRITSETDFVDDARSDFNFDLIEAGDRAEVSCKVDTSGQWVARKVIEGNVKSSDKVKGTVTRVSVEGDTPDIIEIAGVPIALVAGRRIANPSSQFYRIRTVSQLAATVQRCALASERIIQDRRTGESLLIENEEGDPQSAEMALERGIEDIHHYVANIRSATLTEGADRSGREQGFESADRVELALWLDPIDEKITTLQGYFAEFTERLETGVESAANYLDETVLPHLQRDLIPLLEAYRDELEDELADEVRGISSRAETTARLVVVAGVVALAVALLLGILVWRSISKPILSLQEAALKIGRGQLDTRVHIDSRDELGILADAFNHMAEALAGTTVSVDNLNNVIDSMAGSLLILDRDARITSVNRAALTLLRYEREDLIGRPFDLICTNATDISENIDHWDGGEGILKIEEKTFQRKDGTTVPVSFSGAALRGGEGPAKGFVCVAQDLTERKRIEEQIRMALAEKELLLREVHHRVKNNLQVISSLLDLQSSYLTEGNAEDAFKESQNRIRSMALIHEQLYRAADVDKIDFKSYTELLVDHLFRSFGTDHDSIRLKTRVDDLQLNLDQALSCGLIINELVTNSVKHAFPDSSDGEVQIRFTTEDPGKNVLTVSDNGRGLSEDFDITSTHSLGMTLVTALVRQLRGNLHVGNKGGAEFRIVFPSETTSDKALSS